jgi:hypothetical protein
MSDDGWITPKKAAPATPGGSKWDNVSSPRGKVSATPPKKKMKSSPAVNPEMQELLKKEMTAKPGTSIWSFDDIMFISFFELMHVRTRLYDRR